MKEPPKRSSKINNAKNDKNIIRKSIKGKTSLERNYQKQFKKRSMHIPNKINANLSNNFNHSDSTNIKEVTSNKNNRKKINKNPTNKNLKSDEIPVSSDILLNSNAKPDNQDRLIINLKNELDIDIQEYLSTEPDDMDYDDAIKRDHRTFCTYFWNKSKSNSIILSAFLLSEPLKPRPFKLLLFILDIDLYLFVNGLFFSEDYISELFNTSDDEGLLNFIERLMNRFIYITFVGVILNYIID